MAKNKNKNRSFYNSINEPAEQEPVAPSQDDVAEEEAGFQAQVDALAPETISQPEPTPEPTPEVQAPVEQPVQQITQPEPVVAVQPVVAPVAPVQDLQAMLAATAAAVAATGKLPVQPKVDRYPDRKKRSEIVSPVKTMWAICDLMIAADPTARRKDMIEAGIKAGIAFYTARTQYQAWFTARRESLKNAAAAQAAQAQ
jgi:hypothetical protein